MDVDPQERFEHWCHRLLGLDPVRHPLLYSFALERRDHYAQLLGFDTIGDLV